MNDKKGLTIGVTITVVAVVLIAAILGIYRLAGGQWTSPPPPPPAAYCRAAMDGETADLTIEQAGNAAIIAAVATQRGLAPRAVSIALTTAFQESGIRNLDYGDRDSLGLFQQRPSMGWGTKEQVMDPFYSSGKFYDVMVTVDDWETADIGDVAQEVQRSGFPDAYDKHVATARLIASALSGETPASWSCLVRDPAPADPAQLLSLLTQAYGATIHAVPMAATATDPARITITAASETTAWSAGTFAQSWAKQTGVTKVSVGKSEWKASAAVLSGWVAGTTPATATQVVITF